MKKYWKQEEKPLVGKNSGHGMMLTTFEEKRTLVIHNAEENGLRKPQLYKTDDSGDKLVLGPGFNP
jgi:hypothetical protein